MAGNETSTLAAATEDRTARLLSTAHPFLLEQMAEFGPTYFNPLIGLTHAETFENLSDMCGFLHTLTRKDVGMDSENERAVLLMLQTMWTAAQYSARVCESANGTNGGAA